MAIPKLEDMVGESIIAHVPRFHEIELQLLKLHAVENSGLWVENQKLTDQMLGSLRIPASAKTPIFFLPFHQITFVIGSLDALSLSEKAFGLKPGE